MTYELDKEDIMAMVRGVTPSYDAIAHPVIQKAGKMWGGHSETWEWGDLSTFSEEELMWIYSLCKQSRIKS